MRNEKTQVIRQIILAGALIGTSFFLGFYFGGERIPYKERVAAVANKDLPEEINAGERVDFNPYWKAWSIIDEKFVGSEGEVTTSNQERVWGSIEGLVESLDDPYSIFLPPEDSEIFNENIQGNFGGVGMEIGVRDDVLTVIAPLKNTPAERAGIQTGDKILEIDGEITADMKTDEAVKLIRGEVGTRVVLTIAREEKPEPFEVEITRDTITIPIIDSRLRDDGIFVIELYSFTATAPTEFRKALQRFLLEGEGKLILDLRNNPGGFLNGAVDMASWFLPAGEVIVTEDFGGKKEDIVYRSKGYDIFDDTLEMIILINKGSASASEILAGALHEHGIATLVGTQSFGKGSVQELVKITNDTSLKITVARWKTPKGTSISDNGLTPDVNIEITQKDRENLRDPQLMRAVELLLE